MARFHKNHWLKKHGHLLLLLYVPLYLWGFFTLERLIDGSQPYWVSYLPVDELIPFCEVFVIPYLLWYPYLFLSGLIPLLQKDTKNFRRYMYFIMASFSLSLVIFLLFPNGQNLRPASFPRDNVFTRLVAALYAVDTNTNVLPSIHVAGCLPGLAMAYHNDRLRRWRWLWLVLTVLISLSTVFIKQHSLLDLLAGLAMCVPLYFLIYRKA